MPREEGQRGLQGGQGLRAILQAAQLGELMIVKTYRFRYNYYSMICDYLWLGELVAYCARIHIVNALCTAYKLRQEVDDPCKRASRVEQISSTWNAVVVAYSKMVHFNRFEEYLLLQIPEREGHRL